VKAEMTAMEAIQSATLSPAVFLNLQHTLGTVEKGKIADLLLLGAKSARKYQYYTTNKCRVPEWPFA
jgi:imidazolonepropionase-like amidohydrolase